jgi:CheY-like chemotaxis protein
MSPEELGVVFEPFRQAGDQRRQTRGTGLGLTISRDLVELMGSELQVESRLGEGTTFWFDLELSEVADWEEVLPTEERRIVGIEGRTPKVLVVDDNWQNRVVIVDLLSPLGFEVWEAQDGSMGLTRASEFRPDVIITDLVMPGVSGVEFIHSLRQSFAQDVVIIALSASAYDKDRRESLSAGADAFVRKPVKADTLLTELRQRLDIEWVYADDGQRDGIRPGEDVGGAVPMMPPPPDELATLFDLVVMGDVRGIQERAEALDRADNRFRPFAAELRQLAKGFQIEKIRELLELYQE